MSWIPPSGIRLDFAYARDASWRGGRSSGASGKLHPPNPDDPAMSACGATPLFEDHGEPIVDVPDYMRCMRSGCRQRFDEAT